MLNKWWLPVLQLFLLLCIWLTSQPCCPAHRCPRAASWWCSCHSCPSEDLSTIMAALQPHLHIDCPWLLSLSKPCPRGGHKGPAQWNAYGSLPTSSVSQQCWSEPGLPSLPWWHCSLLVYLLPPPSAASLLWLPFGTAQGITWALCSLRRPLSLGVLRAHAILCWLKFINVYLQPRPLPRTFNLNIHGSVLFFWSVPQTF